MSLIQKLIEWLKWFFREEPEEPPPAPPPPPSGDYPAAILNLLTIHNAERSKVGSPAIELDRRLYQAAQKHADWMAVSQSLDHTGADGSSHMDRIEAEGYKPWGSGENIAMGFESEEAVARGWMSSSGHRANILDRDWEDAGFGVATDNRGRKWWCAVFAAPLNSESLILRSPVSVEPDGISADPPIRHERVANVRAYGALGDGSTNDTRAFQAAFDYARTADVPVYAPAGIYVVDSITVDHGAVFYGDGNKTILRTVDSTAEIFRIDLGAGGVINYAGFSEFRAEAHFTSDGVAHSVALFRLVGTGNCYFQWSRFQNIICLGFYAFYASQASSHVTAFGNEGPTNWCHFDNITLQQFTRKQKIGWMFNTGSGTGNTFTDCGGYVDLFGWLYQGGAVVVGDIVIRGGKFGSDNAKTSRVFAVGDNTQYRSRIRLQSLNADAGMAGILQLSTVGTAVYDDIIVDVTRGGACIMGEHPRLLNSNLGFTRGPVPASRPGVLHGDAR